MRVLVTGSAGFIGYHLIARLLREGHTVVGLDNFASGSRDNIADLQTRAKFEFHEHDIVKPLPVDCHFDQIYDLACPASPTDFDQRALEILAVCSQGVWNLLELAHRHRTVLLHTSTSEVYGDPQEHPQREAYWGNVNPIGLRSCYDEGKRFAEALMVNHWRRHQTKIRIARVFNTYGPRMRADDGRALPNFITQALRGAPVTVHGDGSQTRSFCYVTDLVDGLIRLANSSVTEPINLGNPQEISMRDIAREVIEQIGSPSSIQLTPRPADDPCVRRPDIARATSQLDWTPQVDRRDGLSKTIEWFRSGTVR